MAKGTTVVKTQRKVNVLTPFPTLVYHRGLGLDEKKMSKQLSQERGTKNDGDPISVQTLGDPGPRLARTEVEFLKKKWQFATG